MMGVLKCSVSQDFPGGTPRLRSPNIRLLDTLLPYVACCRPSVDTPLKRLKDETYSVKVHFIGEPFLTFSTLRMGFEVITKLSEHVRCTWYNKKSPLRLGGSPATCHPQSGCNNMHNEEGSPTSETCRYEFRNPHRTRRQFDRRNNSSQFDFHLWPLCSSANLHLLTYFMQQL